MAGEAAATGVSQRLDGRRRVIVALRRLGPVSRAELARRTALAPSTVSAIVADLMRVGLVVEQRDGQVPAVGDRGGRPATRLALHRSAGVVAGIDFGKRHLRIAVADLSHAFLAEHAEPLTRDRPAREDIKDAVALLDTALHAAGLERDQVIGVGMGIPGPVDQSTGQLGDSTILPGWVGVEAAPAMSEALGLPVEVDNDANLGALSEWMWGAARGHSEVVYLKVATGIGGGLIIGGRPYGGAGGTAGEIGHTVIDPTGPICRCGNRGCLEMLAGTDAVLDALRPAHGDDLALGDAIAMARDGDVGCRRAIGDVGRSIGSALATVCNIVNPECVVVGGDLGAAGDLLLEPLREALRQGAIRSAARDVDVVVGALGDRAEVLGAVALALRSGDLLAAAAGD
jgi:predicted NBD/HSP70 family sugar kinase